MHCPYHFKSDRKVNPTLIAYRSIAESSFLQIAIVERLLILELNALLAVASYTSVPTKPM